MEGRKIGTKPIFWGTDLRRKNVKPIWILWRRRLEIRLVITALQLLVSDGSLDHNSALFGNGHGEVDIGR